VGGAVRAVLGEDVGCHLTYALTYARYRVEVPAGLAGLAYQTATIDRAGTILALTIIDRQFAEQGTEVSFVWASTRTQYRRS
jgi:vanillate/3-O-methylgallate O-demethylase